MNANLPLARFKLGHVVATPNALSRLTQEDILMGSAAVGLAKISFPNSLP